MTPYYDEDGITIYHGDCREVDAWLAADVLVTDPPYGIDYESGQDGVLPRSIEGDKDTASRDTALQMWAPKPALVFGSWRAPRPSTTRMLLIWNTMGALGMGALDLPWKPGHQEIYVIGSGFAGHRGCDVLTHAPVQAMASNGRTHPHEKPVRLLHDLIAKCPPGSVADPFMGTGATLVTAKAAGRSAIGIELSERYCEIAAKRLAQGVLDLGAPS